LCENLNAEIASGSIKSFVDTVGYLSWTFFARRAKANPSFYGAVSSDDSDVEALFDTVAKDALEKLRDQGCIECDADFTAGGDVGSSSLGHAASEFYLKYKTPKQILLGLSECGKMIKGEMIARSEKRSGDDLRDQPFSGLRPAAELGVAWLFYTIACTHEFDELPVRHNEEILNEQLSANLMWGADASGLISRNGRSSYLDPEVYADPHTK
jgi:replicative superfamily II helicase